MSDSPAPSPAPHPAAPATNPGGPAIHGGPETQAALADFGMKLFLASLAILFAASLIAYLAIRFAAESWPPPGLPRLPAGFWISTGILLYSSVTMQAALAAIRAGRAGAFRRWITLTFALGLFFLGAQSFCWISLWAQGIPRDVKLFLYAFYFLPMLHGAHVLGGLIPLGIITRRARAGAYSAQSHAGVRSVARYWHFLDAVWIALFTTLFFTL